MASNATYNFFLRLLERTLISSTRSFRMTLNDEASEWGNQFSPNISLTTFCKKKYKIMVTLVRFKYSPNLLTKMLTKFHQPGNGICF